MNLVLDMNKVAYATFKWVNGKGSERLECPDQPTVNGQEVTESDMAPATSIRPRESMLARARSRGLLDTWTALCIFQFSNSHSLTFKDKEAIELWGAWKGHIFNRPTNNKKKGKCK